MLDVLTNCDYNKRRVKPWAGICSCKPISTAFWRTAASRWRAGLPIDWLLITTFARVGPDLILISRITGNIRLKFKLYPIQQEDLQHDRNPLRSRDRRQP
jgi:hypothetical protein